MVKRKIRNGKTARTKEKEIAEALDVIYPFDNPLKKNRVTSYNGIPSNPGKMIRFDAHMPFLTGFHLVI